MADIRSFYEYIDRQKQTGRIQLLANGDYAVPVILQRLSLESIIIETLELSPLRTDGFTLTGVMQQQGRSYACTMTAANRAEGYDILFQARLEQDGDKLLREFYPSALSYTALNFYSTPTDFLDSVWFREAVIAADTKEKNGTALFSLTIVYDKKSFLFENFRDFLPEAGEPITLTGDIRNPFGEARYVVEGTFLKQVQLPLYNKKEMAEECTLVINSHAPVENGENGGENEYQCRVGVKFLVSIPKLPKQSIWVSIDFGDFGDVFYLYVNFPNGISLNDTAEFIFSMTGKSGLPDFPEWISFGSVPLVGIMMAVERKKLVGCAFYFALDLPDVPIPFFEREQGGAEAELTIQWNNLDIGGFLSVVAGFCGVFNNHHLTINVMLPDLEIKGIYEQEVGDERANGIFPGFMDLAVRYIRLQGILSEHCYQMDFELTNRNLPEIPMGQQSFAIDTVMGSVEYSPKGLQLSVMLEFTLLTAIIQLEGSYQKKDEQQLLTLKGGLAKSFSLSELIALITGKEVTDTSLDFVVRELFIYYQTRLSGKGESKHSLGEPVYFEFLCAIAFQWGEENEIASSFHLRWEDNKYQFKITAGITLFECFDFAASCQVKVEGGTAVFWDFKFFSKIRSVEIKAEYDDKHNFTFFVKDFNFGELIEGLISLIEPEHNWYLPWPFTILKQITLGELEVLIDRENNKIHATYDINLNILFLNVTSIELLYDYGESDFLINVHTNAKMEMNEEWDADERRTGEREIYGLNLLKDQFPVIKQAGKRMFSLQYLGVGQHIKVEIPKFFDEKAFPELLKNMKESIRREGRPELDMNNNWVAALQLQLIDAIDITLLMCDPVFYGLQIDIGKSQGLVEQLAGLSFTVLYSKITETIGMFYARLKFPEAFRKIELGGIELFLGEIAVWIYTNGNFKIDMGFPHNKDFSNSFGLTYMLFTGKGGFYFGLLNGDTSKAVPEVAKGHFETVMELGIGISAGIGREISAGPLRAGAYVMLVAIFQGVIANYVPAVEEQEQVVYYKVKAFADVTAAIYGSVDFVLIKIGFSVNLSFSTELILESFQPTELSVHLSLSVEAYIKILFIKIEFSFSFLWEDTFVLGEKSAAPWELNIQRAGLLQEKAPCYHIQWYDGKVIEQKQEICAEIIYYLTFDEPQFGKKNSGKRKIAFLSLLHGMEEQTCCKLGYADKQETPFAKLAEICFRRAVRSVRYDGQREPVVNRQLMEYLYEYLCGSDSFIEGFMFEKLDCFLACNVAFSFIKSVAIEDDGEETWIDGIPFPLYPKMELIWFTAPDTTVVYNLQQEPLVGEHFFEEMQAYYEQLGVWNQYSHPERMRVFEKEGGKHSASISEFMFAQYFHMLTKVIVSLALDKVGEEEMSLNQAVDLLIDSGTIKQAAGMISRFSYGGSRAYVGGEGTRSMYDFARQEFDGRTPESFSKTEVIHRMSIRLKEKESDVPAVPDLLMQTPAIQLRQRMFAGQTFPSASNEDILEWSFTKANLNYPEGVLQMSHQPVMMPLYRRQPKRLELKNPQEVLGKEGASFWEIQERSSENFQIVSYCGTEHCDNENESGQPLPYSFERGFLLHIPVKASKGDIFELEPPGYALIRKLTAILQDDGIISIKPYRYTNELDTENCGVACIKDDVYLYRTNLCLEAEKPELMTYIRSGKQVMTEERTYGNSARLTETIPFLSLLKDASMVNGRGYYIKFPLDKKHILEDGKMTLLLWVQTKNQADEIKIMDKEVTKESHPLLLTEKEISIFAYEPGTFAFYLGEEENDSEIQKQYQMLGYQILENDYFRASNESSAVVAQKMKGGRGYSQIVPSFLFAKGDGETPYGGIKEGSNLKLNFRLLDILGNRTACGKTWEIPYGYTDPLLPISVYPHTKCSYELERSGDSFVCAVTFQYVKETRTAQLQKRNGGDNDNLQLACQQLECGDVRCFIELCKEEMQVDKAPLLNYIRGLQRGEKPEPVSYKLPFAGGDRIKEIRAAFILKRDEKLLADSLRGSREADSILVVKSEITENAEKIKKEYLAVRGWDSRLFYVPPVSLSFCGHALWTLPPLSNRLHQIKDVTVEDGAGIIQSVSYCDVDLEEWIDDFLMDLEGFLKPDSIYFKHRDVCEDLLAVKKRLAHVMALEVKKISGSVEEPLFRNAAINYYENQMLQNLFAGRRMDGVILLKSEQTAGSGTAWCFQAAADCEGFSLKAGKLKSDGILPVGICAADISKNMKLRTNLKLSFTDWEIEGENIYDFLTNQEQNIVSYSVEADLPYKRFPQMPVLKSQKYTGKSVAAGSEQEDLFRWEYQVSFVHPTAEQDIVTLCLQPDNEINTRCMEEGFLPAMAQYRYLRERFPLEENLKEVLVDCCQKICESWGNRSLLSEGMAFSENYNIHFSLFFDKRKLFITESGISPDLIAIQMRGKNEEYFALEREGDVYTMPEEPAQPYEFLFTVTDFDIRDVNQINARMSVTRNQTIEEIDDIFIYRTGEVSFTDNLPVSLMRQEKLDFGRFEQRNFTTNILVLNRMFAKSMMEVSCKVPVSLYGEEIIYSSLSVLYVPKIVSGGNDGGQNKMITDIYNRIEEWLQEHFGGAGKDLIIQVRLALFAVEDTERNLVEFSDLEFHADA